MLSSLMFPAIMAVTAIILVFMILAQKKDGGIKLPQAIGGSASGLDLSDAEKVVINHAREVKRKREETAAVAEFIADLSTVDKTQANG